jgi:hypothetical protein
MDIRYRGDHTLGSRRPANVVSTMQMELKAFIHLIVMTLPQREVMTGTRCRVPCVRLKAISVCTSLPLPLMIRHIFLILSNPERSFAARLRTERRNGMVS